jgi:flagellar hook-length control protein FliK
LAALTATSNGSTELAQEASRPETVQSLDDISSSFVSSLVGGPQRPVTTVMDWISMQSQERAAPLVPHEVRLDAGAIQLEIQKMVKQGGGHVVMELTPPDQSKFTIELKLDERGNAMLIVEGVSDSTKTRLEQSAPQLREQFQQMGLELQLDMRQQGQSASSNAANFGDYQERGSGDNHAAGDPSKVLTQREAGALRARETGSNQVYLYA